MKTLQEVEPRNLVTAAGTISAAGSYYLANDISGKITIIADHVTLDLNGFTIFAGDSNALEVSNASHVKVYNGSMVDSGSEVVASAGLVALNGGDLIFSDLRISDSAGDCVTIASPTGLVTLQRLHCERLQSGGIVIRQFAELPLSVVLRDNVIIDANISTNLTIGAILVAQNTANPSHMIITGNRVINPRTVAYSISDTTGATAFGEMLDNLASDCGSTGYFISADVLLARNRSVGCATAFSLSGVTRASPVTALNAAPGAWDNIEE
jgi:hypothetical protein